LADAPQTVAAIIVAAGSGRRFGDSGTRKQYRPLRGIPLLAWALAPFVEHPRVTRIAVVVPADDVRVPPDWLTRPGVELVPGGAERTDSVRAGLQALGSHDRVLVHDGARPLVTRSLIDRVLDADAHWGVVPGVPVTDTLKEVGSDGIVIRTPDRSRLRSVQTPQSFPLLLLRDVHHRAQNEGLVATDDAGLLERYGHEVRVVEGDPMNIKVTTTHDLVIAEALARRLPLPVF
jgi:2-C-methyl-D-erythritol 4-phosphate cytidylyltransferase